MHFKAHIIFVDDFLMQGPTDELDELACVACTLGCIQCSAGRQGSAFRVGVVRCGADRFGVEREVSLWWIRTKDPAADLEIVATQKHNAQRFRRWPA